MTIGNENTADHSNSFPIRLLHFISSDKLSEAITLLLKLGVQSSAIYSDFLASCRRNLNDQLSTIQSQKQFAVQATIFLYLLKDAVDVLEFVDNCCSAFLADLSLVTALSQRFFPNQIQKQTMELATLLTLTFTNFNYHNCHADEVQLWIGKKCIRLSEPKHFLPL
ncbi:unnamed protein product [Gongylonema pulchrum]|uniref:Uncharacterized protein n=1 Tax=Gongylonema pulchrum TaxID=637853 RepID=A0A183EIG1_9BILA|nr:unnamed protein product [Gongylonema pulchrum]